jgi:hypothetical protein
MVLEIAGGSPKSPAVSVVWFCFFVPNAWLNMPAARIRHGHPDCICAAIDRSAKSPT